MAQQSLKDPYIFDFLTLANGFHERELETGLPSIEQLERALADHSGDE
jgi:predicted nuclease of restriction endonuclease-like (RecB) superfamily